jgi:hypothetical protein
MDAVSLCFGGECGGSLAAFPAEVKAQLKEMFDAFDADLDANHMRTWPGGLMIDGFICKKADVQTLMHKMNMRL